MAPEHHNDSPPNTITPERPDTPQPEHFERDALAREIQAEHLNRHLQHHARNDFILTPWPLPPERLRTSRGLGHKLEQLSPRILQLLALAQTREPSTFTRTPPYPGHPDSNAQTWAPSSEHHSPDSPCLTATP